MIADAHKYSIIYADPPWTYNDKCNAGERGAGFKYATMSIDDIKALPIQSIAAEDCVLFIWVTFPLMQEGLDTIKSWGFKYKTVGFTWIKLTSAWEKAAMKLLKILPFGIPLIERLIFMGMGNWTRSNSEVCLLAVKGKPKRISASVHSVILRPIRKHSQKPDEARERIVKLIGDVPRVELFARERAHGWDSWGLEVESDIDLVYRGS